MSRNFISDITNAKQPITNWLMLCWYILIIYKQEAAMQQILSVNQAPPFIKGAFFIY
ncbi:MAG: hypothetical protein ACOH2A_14385 [Sphingobacteriaceae bacterium]